MLLLYATALTIGVLVLVRSYDAHERSLRKGAIAQLSGVTGTLATQLDGNRLKRLLERYDTPGVLIKNTQDAWYFTLYNAMEKGLRSAELKHPLLLLALDTSRNELQTVVTSAAHPTFRAAYQGAGAQELRRYLGQGAAGSFQTERDGMLIIADPVRNHAGHTIGVLVARSSLAELEHGARMALMKEASVVAVLFALLGLLLFRRVGRMLRHEEVQYNDLRIRHSGMTDSIAYASRIQSALVPDPERYRELFDDFFVLNRPRDVVSGDFHWYHRISGHECLVAAADCTGHGLPGAMIATIACSLLNDMGEELNRLNPAELLNRLNRSMIRALHQDGHRVGAGDGMDISLCRINRKTHELQFAGAYRPLYRVHRGQLQVINGDRMPIGGNHHGIDRKFTLHRISYQPGDRIYLFSDGYVDQFGGPHRRRFMASRLGDLLVANHQMPMAMQAEALEKAFLEWKGAEAQMDDVCLLGIAV